MALVTVYDAENIGSATDTIAATLAGVKLHLGQSNLVPDRNSTLAALHAGEATFDGYAAQSVTWSTPSRADDGAIEVVGTVPEFRPTGAVTPNSIYYWYLTDTAATALYLAAGFDSPPLPMGSTLDAIVITLRWRPNNLGLFVVVS